MVQPILQRVFIESMRHLEEFISPLNLRYARVGRFRCQRRSSYSMSFMPGIILVAFLWTFTSELISLPMCGAQTWLAYTPGVVLWATCTGLRTIVYLSLYSNVLQRIPSSLFALFIFCWQWFRNFSRASTVTLISFSFFTVFSWQACPSVYTGVGSWWALVCIGVVTHFDLQVKLK